MNFRGAGEVPGFVKQIPTPPATSVRIKLSAPFICLDKLYPFDFTGVDQPDK